MVHSGYEASAVNDLFGSVRGMWQEVKARAFGQYEDASALRLLDEPTKPGTCRSAGADRRTRGRGDAGLSGRESGHGPSASVDPDSLEVAPGTAHENLEGSVPSLANEEDLRKALEQAFDYRGDVSITRKDGTKIEGYIFDRVAVEAASLTASCDCCRKTDLPG